MSKFLFSTVAASWLLVAVTTASGQQPFLVRSALQPPPAGPSALPSPSDLQVNPFNEEPAPAAEPQAAQVEVVPLPEAEKKARQVTVNLVLTEDKPTTAVFRRKGGEVLAEQVYLSVPKLQFEVAISSPYTEDVKVLLPVPKESAVYRAFVEFGEKDPQRVLAELAKIDPPAVSVVALNKPVRREKWHDAAMVDCGLFNHWRPLYEVWLDAANMDLPELVAVPRADCFLYDLTKSTINNSVFAEPIERLFWLSGEPERFSRRPQMPAEPMMEGVAPGPIGPAG
jgi:hypothetical protein